MKDGPWPPLIVDRRGDAVVGGGNFHNTQCDCAFSCDADDIGAEMATVYRIILKLADGWSAEDARASLRRSMDAVSAQGADGASAPGREDRKHPDARTPEIIRLDASRWTNVLDFYDAILLALGAPDWHGRSINALIDSIIGGDINAVEPPYVIVIDGTSSIDASILDHIVTVKDFLAEVREQVRTQWDRHVDASIEIAS